MIANVRKWRLAPDGQPGTIAFRFEIEPGACNDDSRGLFRLIRMNLAVITACSPPNRAAAPPPISELVLASWGPPAYPAIARSGSMAGVVVLELSINEKGSVTGSLPLSTSSALFTQAAVGHSKTWTFRPTTQRRGIVVYEFALDNHDCVRQERTVFWRVSADSVKLSACPLSM